MSLLDDDPVAAMNAAYSALRLDEGVKALFAHMAETSRRFREEHGPFKATGYDDGMTVISLKDGAPWFYMPTKTFEKLTAGESRA